MSQNPFELASQHQQQVKQQMDTLRETFDRNRIEKCISLFHQTVERFVAFVEAYGYPAASLLEFEGQRCVGYPLYSSHQTEGEEYFDGSPLTLLINESRQVLYMHETLESGHNSYNPPINAYPPVRFFVPTSYEEYREAGRLAYRQRNSGDSILFGTDLVWWVAYMEYFMERYVQYGFSEGMELNTWSWYRGPDLYYRESVKDRVFPEGFVFEQYISRRGRS